MSNGSQLSVFRKSLLPPSLGQKMGAVSTYTPVTIYQSIRRHNPQGLNLHISFFKQAYLMFSAPGAYYWTVSMEIHKTNTHVCIVRGQLCLLVWPAKPLTSRLPAPSRTKREHSRDTQHWLEHRSQFEVCNKHCIRPSDRKNWTVLSRQFRVCGVQHSDENWRRRGMGIQLRKCMVWNEWSASAKYCVRDRSAESMQSYPLKVILKICVSVLFSLLTVLSVVSINAVIC
jgi:hypothetical protein